MAIYRGWGVRKFIVTGIQMRNKGSQAMFLALRSALESIYPDCEVIGFANKYSDPGQYAFKLLPYDAYTRFLLKYRLEKVPFLPQVASHFLGMMKKDGRWVGSVSRMKRALREADAIFDASGYTLGSGWGKEGGRLLLETIRTARRYGKDIILMPQSFGPFDWGEADDAEFLEEIRKELGYCLNIYAREREGYDALKSLGLGNVTLSADMVIREKVFPEVREILASSTGKGIEYPMSGAVGLIINENVFRVGNASAVMQLYVHILDRLIDNGESVYVLNTSTADADLVKEVVGRAKSPEAVSLISGEYSSPQLIDIIGRFKYVVASRYHSIVFAYRSGVPAVILGWSSKYKDLAEHFAQKDYMFDIREPNAEGIFEQIDTMARRYDEESLIIKGHLGVVQATSVVRDAVAHLKKGSCAELDAIQRSRGLGQAWSGAAGDPSAL